MGDVEESRSSHGCSHYKRKAKFVTPCCDKIYTCRFCHNENEDHTLDRFAIKEIICGICKTRQNVQTECENCHIKFGKYSCLICNFFDDEVKGHFHCKPCGICRIGGRKNYYHCNKCNMCLPVKLKIEGHKCIENVSRSNCPVCLEDIHTSRISCYITPCGHMLHRPCMGALLSSGHYTCPICQKSFKRMVNLIERYDRAIKETPMPPEFEDCYVNILCKDCNKPSITKYHILALKCMECGCYNTVRDQGPLLHRSEVPPEVLRLIPVGPDGYSEN